jgi:hypothetical protein
MTLEQQVHKLEVRVRELERQLSRLVPGKQAAQYQHEPNPETLGRIVKNIAKTMSEDSEGNKP